MTMNAKQYRSAIEALGLTQVAAGDFLGIGARTSRRYAAPKGIGSPIPPAIAKLLRVMIHHNLTPQDIDACK